MARRVQPDLEFIKGIQKAGGTTLKKCYQCATCAVVCPLSPDEGPFPRKEMIWAQWGLKDKLATDPAVWLCHQCGDCSAYCPRGAKPGDVLGAIRAMAIRHYASPKALWTMFNEPGYLPFLFAVAFAIIIGVMVAYHGGFEIPEGPVRYSEGFWHGFMPVVLVDAIFLPLVGLVALFSARGVINLWKDLCQSQGISPKLKPSAGEFLDLYVWPTIGEILQHTRFQKCGATKERATGHMMVLWAFIILFVVTNIVFIGADFLGFHTPWKIYNPVKILANVGAVLLIVGIFMILSMRREKTSQGILQSSYNDWLLIWLIVTVGLSGLGAELLRLANIKFLAYPVYLLHLASVFVLFLSLPFSKFAHLLYRTTVMVFERYSNAQKAAAASGEGQ
ncbi:heterodisulfide reductase [Thermosulfuriphilus ammonigenes]|uniref:Heterodisulfide reductase n=1 Tax=Thermosulfuriphilus ammonigenes TaxID=1936021 RepID=A0A6G7PV01_9BACT|nr:quinone-interacting membrane-bound oxidoreductase complex subunit QmoC [Thermosulfuriphilus ammonigenes]MBA2848501.1 quinone-modifying oxidoreductase subunit QmoC [Thermosulfuriphilus ammonigenes]QIJ71351.1 heterodisulfide reductase [Thermosulfuriphilus ammonigenes]HFB83300.1 heterodisulfide reductase [Thermodesulfatator sp.]